MRLLVHSPAVYQRVGHSYDYVEGLGTALAEVGVDVHVLGLEGDRRLSPALTSHSVRWTPKTARRTSAITQIRWGLMRMADQARLARHMVHLASSLQVDHVLLETFEYVTMARALRRLETSYSAIVHDTNFNAQHKSGVAAAYKTLVRGSVRQIVEGARPAFVHGEAMRDNLAEILGLATPPAVLPYGAPAPDDDPMARAEARAALGLEGEGPILLAFGTLRTDKNYDLLLDALADVPAWRLLVAGPEAELSYDDLRRKAGERGVGGRLIVREGYVDRPDQRAYFRAADAVAAIYDPSIRHESGTAILARTYLTPLVGHGPPDLQRYIEGNGVGWFVSSPDPSGLAGALRQVGEMTSEAQAAMEASIRACAEGGSWRAVRDEFLGCVDGERDPSSVAGSAVHAPGG